MGSHYSQGGDIIHRGTVFPRQRCFYVLFKSIELQIRQVISHHLKDSLQRASTSVLDKIKEDEDVQFHWSKVSTDVHDHKDADKLLQE